MSRKVAFGLKRGDPKRMIGVKDRRSFRTDLMLAAS